MSSVATTSSTIEVLKVQSTDWSKAELRPASADPLDAPLAVTPETREAAAAAASIGGAWAAVVVGPNRAYNFTLALGAENIF